MYSLGMNKLFSLSYMLYLPEKKRKLSKLNVSQLGTSSSERVK